MSDASGTHGDTVGGDKITVGDIEGSVAAIGAGAKVIYQHVERSLTAVEVASQAEELEHKRLADAVTGYVQRLQGHAEQARDSARSRNPYKGLLEFDIDDAGRFYGRIADTDALMACLQRDQLTVLHAEGGAGKTSLLKGGAMPRLLADSHVPLYVRPGPAPTHEAIKRELITQLDKTDHLRKTSLRDFLHQTTLLLGAQRLIVMLDQCEELFTLQDEDTRKSFVSQLASCLDDDTLSVRWILSIRSESFSELSSFQPQVRHPFANELQLKLLDASQARVAIEEPARSNGVPFEDGLVDTLLNDLGAPSIAPPQLQLVCATLYDALDGGTTITRKMYEQAGSTTGILRDYLDRTLASNFSPGERDTAWLALAAIADERGHVAGAREISATLRTYGISEADTGRVLDRLAAGHLLHVRDQRYELASDKLLPRIQSWQAEREVLEKAREEAVRQFERMRGSALRGLLGGALGFSLAFFVTYNAQVSFRPLLGYLTILRALPGALAGFFLLLFVDVALASYEGPQRWMRWLVGGLAGAISFAAALLSHGVLRSFTNAELALAAAEGGLWGLVAGLGTVWLLGSRRPLWQTLPVVTIASGFTLWLAERFGGAFQEPPNLMLVAVAGAVMPLLILGVARIADTNGGRL